MVAAGIVRVTGCEARDGCPEPVEWLLRSESRCGCATWARQEFCAGHAGVIREALAEQELGAVAFCHWCRSRLRILSVDPWTPAAPMAPVPVTRKPAARKHKGFEVTPEVLAVIMGPGSQRDVGARLGIRPSKVGEIRKANGFLGEPDWGDSLTDDEFAFVMGRTVAPRVAEVFGVSSNTVRRFRRDHGYEK